MAFSEGSVGDSPIVDFPSDLTVDIFLKAAFVKQTMPPKQIGITSASSWRRAADSILRDSRLCPRHVLGFSWQTWLKS